MIHINDSSIPSLHIKHRAMVWQENLSFFFRTLSKLFASLTVSGALYLYLSPVPLATTLVLAASSSWLICDQFYWETFLARINMGGKLLNHHDVHRAKASRTSSFYQTVMLLTVVCVYYFNFDLLGTLSLAAYTFVHSLVFVITASCLTSKWRMSVSYRALATGLPTINLPSLQHSSWLSTLQSTNLVFKKNPLSYLHNSHTIYSLIRHYEGVTSKNMKPLPLELALGFIDLEIFTECLKCYDIRSADYRSTYQATIALTTLLSRLPENIDKDTFSTLKEIDRILLAHPPSPPPSSPSSAKPSVSSPHFPTMRHKHIVANPTVSGESSPTVPSKSLSQSFFPVKKLSIAPLLLDGELPPELSNSILPTLAYTLNHIPLPNNTQLPNLQISIPQFRWLNYAGFRIPTQTHRLRISKVTPSPFAALRPAEYATFRQAINTILDAVRSPLASNVFWPSKLRDSTVRIARLSRLSVRFCRYYVQLNNALLASLSLNSPGKKYSIRLHRKTSSRKSLYLGISLAGRAVKLAQDFHNLLDTISVKLAITSLNIPIFREIGDIMFLCKKLETNVFTYIPQLSTGSGMPRFYLMHGNYEGCKHDVLSNHLKFNSLFSTSYNHCGENIKTVPRLDQQTTPLPTEEVVVEHLRRIFNFDSPGFAGALSLKSATLRLPFWFHCTKYHNAVCILRSGKINVSHTTYSGAFISTQMERQFGDFVFALSRHTPLMSNTYNKTRSEATRLWHGCKQPISLAGNLVAISYPEFLNDGPFISCLSEIGTVYIDPQKRPAFLQLGVDGALIPLYTTESLFKVCSSIRAVSNQSTTCPSVLNSPLPAHLMLTRRSFLGSTAVEMDCQPLKKQVSDAQQCVPNIPTLPH